MGARKYIRDKVRDLVLTSLSLKADLLNDSSLLLKPRVQFLYLHHLYDHNINDLVRLLDLLIENYFFISYSEATEKILNSEIDKPYLVFSLDDGFKDCLRISEIFNRYDIKACFFINPFSISLKNEAEKRKFRINTLNRRNSNNIKYDFLNWKDIETLQQNNHEVGSHTMAHINVANTRIEQFKDDLYESYNIINSKCGTVKHFAWPFGRFHHFTGEAYNAVFDAGYYSCASAVRGCHINSGKRIKNNELLIRRDKLDLKHMTYFITNNIIQENSNSNYSPY